MFEDVWMRQSWVTEAHGEALHKKERPVASAQARQHFTSLSAVAILPVLPIAELRTVPVVASASRGPVALVLQLSLATSSFRPARPKSPADACEHVLRRDPADGAVQAHIVVMLHLTVNQTSCIFERQRLARADALPFELPVLTCG